MRHLQSLLLLVLGFGLSACITTSQISSVLPLSQSVYTVVFEHAPGITHPPVYANGFEIGTYSSEQLGEGGRVMGKITIRNEHQHLMRSNAVFYSSNGRLEYDTVGEEGTPLDNGAKILGFASQPELYWFKAKFQLKNLSGEALQQAQDLYRQAFPN